MKEYSIVGQRLPRVDGVVKATGAARFAADIQLPGMLWGKILRSPYPHARIVNIDTSEAARLPGVVAVITAQDTGEIRHAWVDNPRYPADEYVLATEKVRYVGEEVAAVAAISESVAEKALELIKVQYEELPAVFDPEEAMREGAPSVHEELLRTTTTAWEDWGAKKRPPVTRKIKNNICADFSLGHGDVEQGFRESDYVREDRFAIPATFHGYLEPHAIVANFDSSGKLDVWVPSMGLAHKRFWLAKTLGIPLNQVRLHKVYVGGGFGGRIPLFPCEFLASFLSRKTGRPIKMVLASYETITTCRLSHRMVLTVKTGVKRDGTMVAQRVKILNDPGAYRGSSPIAMFLVYDYSLPIYKVPNVKFDGIGVYTNKSICMSKRGHGSQQARFAIESQLDLIAQDLGLDRVALRLKNVRKVGETLPNGEKLESCGLVECIQKGAAAFAWEKKQAMRGDQEKAVGVGMGISCMFNGTAQYPFASSAIVKLDVDGTVTLLTGGVETGQGADTAMAMIAAEELGIRLEDVALISGDTELCPIDMGNFLSLGVFTTGEAVRRAAADAKRQLLEVAAPALKASVEDLEVKDRRIRVRGDPEKAISYGDTVALSVQKYGGNPIIGKGYQKPVQETEFGTSIARAAVFTDAYTYSVAFAEVEVDKKSGKVRVKNTLTADDIGFAINPLNVEGQVEGQAVMAQGDILFEEIVTREGRIINPTFENYRMPRSTDIADVRNVIVETLEPKGPYGAKEAGECARAAVMAALANAICDAAHIRIKTLPITPARILEAVEESRMTAGQFHVHESQP